jgi:hypothetical protein
MGMDSLPATRKRGEKYTDEEVERGLREIALHSGNTARAARALQSRGITVSRSALELWKNRQHPARYAQIVEEVLPEVYGKLARESEELAQRYAEAEAETLERFREQLPDLKPSDVSTAIRNFAVSRGISIDKAQLLRGRPTAIVETRDLAQLARDLAERRPDVFTFEGSYTPNSDIVDAEVIDDEPNDGKDTAA